MAHGDSAELDARLELARRIAREAGELTLRYFQQPGLEVERKGNGSPVTLADKASEELLRARIASAFPGDGVLGEEFGSAPGRSPYTWILDPIDGTQSFIRGIGTYAVLVGLAREGRGVMGVVELPALDERAFAREGGGAWWSARGGDVRRARVSTTPDLASAWLEVAQAKSFMKGDRWALFESIVKAAWRTHGWLDADAFTMVATGRADAAVQWGVSTWDIAPFDCILHEAGGRMSDWAGARTLDARYVLATNGALHDQLLALLGADAPKAPASESASPAPSR